jgi:hypothetical protein
VFCRAWCDKHGDGVIDAAKKEFKGHVEEMEKQREVDSFNPRAFSQPQTAANGKKVQESLDTEHFTIPFYDEKNPFLNQSYNN